MTMVWRRVALKKLLRAQVESGLDLISPDEICAIRREWARDDAR